ncbi:hypothetical protein [Halopseudomonas pelagia]|uniref:Uncharacterized protein n=1 Tax=Halopseudomonas pelagia TaxID=553151 RepID=A0AA91Z7F2_9GAMM|nr:hypothetical protein [Halopseudomonas pelagia]PCD00954.1 hypothetical protein CO192_02750 [Halopseudomonas pelagia]QFY56135.1 hypothetical protein EAO82_06990 [Halopseudomonas pelagia]
MFNHEMLMASAIWGCLALALLLLWGCLAFVLQKIGLFSNTIAQRQSRILIAFRWVWLLPMNIALITLVLAFVWD